MSGESKLDDPAVVAALDELPLWSAPFGLPLLDAVPLEPWRETVPAAEREAVFADVARRLDVHVAPGEGLRLDVPFACWTARLP